MRSFHLARLAAQAEQLRLQRLARRMALRAGLAAVAALFLLLALLGGHLALAAWLAQTQPVLQAVLWVAGGDLLIAASLALLVLRGTRPGPAEREARMVRDLALAPLRDTADFARTLLRADGLLTRALLILTRLLRPPR